jgi:uncharacterized SAM-binding protein YcdF (DUF218 family)
MKLLAVLLQPLTLVWLLLGGWLLVKLWQRAWSALVAPLLAWGILSVVACTPAVSLLMSKLEDQTPKVVLEDLEAADAIVCLGGGAEPSLTEPTRLHLKTGADRIATGLALLAMRKAPLLVLGGGGYREAGQTYAESEQLLLTLKRLQVPTEGMMSLGVCADTHDEAEKVAALMRLGKWKRVLLVTSAYHMPRAMATFEKAGVPVVAVPCNYVSSVNRIGDLRWWHLPHVEAFGMFGTWFHEVAGTWVYRWRGWL